MRCSIGVLASPEVQPRAKLLRMPASSRELKKGLREKETEEATRRSRDIPGGRALLCSRRELGSMRILFKDPGPELVNGDVLPALKSCGALGNVSSIIR
ncbi:hypothetical protein CVT26_006418 [Gymnopilus dilepis]|uniref:Uncharacterized protein n=1 Tax=Gymnopilus dilepis TaxID=231916 RepID=A0A409Y1V4_9AGAR|nr:hypothetical protein CVT26_006418 [Gymnopilus dilepis]